MSSHPNNDSFLTQENVLAALAFVSPDVDRDTWVKVLMAIHHTFGPAQGKEIARRWSLGSPRFNERSLGITWNSFKGGPDEGITGAYILKLAGQNSWKPPQANSKAPSTPPVAPQRSVQQSQEAAAAAQKTAKIAESLYKAAAPADPAHPYLKKKRIEPMGTLKQIHYDYAATLMGNKPTYPLERGELLVVPVWIGEGISSVQLIDELGTKRSLKHGVIKNGYFPLAQLGPRAETILIGEGYATVASACRAIDTPYGVVTFGNSNLYPVAQRVQSYCRRQCPNAKLVILADRGKESGLPDPQAVQASHALGIPLAIPQTTLPRNDFNDCCNDPSYGDAVAAECIRAAKVAKPGSITDAQSVQQEGASEKDGAPPSREIPPLSAYSPDIGPDTPETASPIPAERIRQEEIAGAMSAPMPTPAVLASMLTRDGGHEGVLVVEGPRGGKKYVKHSVAARILGKALTGCVAYNSAHQLWGINRGHHWQFDIGGDLAEATEANDAVVELIHQALDMGCSPAGYDHPMAKGVRILLEERPELKRGPEPKGYIPFWNGMLDVRTGAFHQPTDPQGLMDWVIPHIWTPDAPAARFLNFLDKITGGNLDVIELLQACFAAVLRGYSPKNFLELVGAGDTGKSALCHWFEWIVGTRRCTSMSPKDLEDNSFIAPRLVGMRVLFIHEAEGWYRGTERLKSLSGGDRQGADAKGRQMHGQSFRFNGLIVVPSNQPIVSAENSTAFEQRRLALRLEHPITKADREIFVRQGGEAWVREQVPGFINWVLSMPEAAMRSVLAEPGETVQAMKQQAIRDNDRLRQWAEDRLDFSDPAARTQVGHLVVNDPLRHANTWLFPSYCKWASEQNIVNKLTPQKFREQFDATLANMGMDHVYLIRPQNKATYVGVKIKPYSDGYS